MSFRTNRLRASLLASAMSMASFSLSPALAQTALSSAPVGAPATSPAATAAIATAANSGVHLDEVIVTGTSSTKQVFKAPYAVTVISAQQIADKAPTSVADALKGTPGLWIESTAGEAGSENVYARGLPGGSYEYFGLQEDGLPIYETEYETYVNADIFERVDLGTQ
jgi:outer membrane receptor for ferric coprogen and ferric-rhodotorulic acid